MRRILSDGVNQPRTLEVLTAAPVRARRKPRDWPNEEKERLIAETLLPGANVSAIARAEGLYPSQLYGWGRKALSSGCAPDGNREEEGQVRAR
ncbi:transposase [Sinorhizobium kostiense]|uniref:transposase n=1 Tax=Sinorhizobium kostiense TaxID=76747 RepID=UPI001F305502|nr:transposase [Sinorhizobium kostiense]